MKRIVEAVGLTAVNVDLAALGADLDRLRVSAEQIRHTSSSRKVFPTKRKRHAETVKSHAKKLLSALSSSHEIDTLLEFLSPFYRRHQDGSPKAYGELMLSLSSLIQDADQIISEANAEIQQGKEAGKLPESSPPPFYSLRSLFWHNPHASVSWIIAWELAPIFKKHFGKEATASTPSEGAEDRTPRGAFVQFVQAVQNYLKLFPGINAVSPHTIATALGRTKSQRDEQNHDRK
ncbi:hypothetical protein QEV83_03850 [Methylocapsa sp. D3K7]|uniref:hypothetical protein n=1 Tax=Methylocapsa sp. D3K7 TaxID=3041435 RepID=UPI00244EA139|nr:hypothetical protein [Methylocapsa sp. D3K7]WGJ15425.1 hypothetical protein QEV83_03850 [Methylocapsa sp. D3K7]